jgi:hypothetical protein
VFGGLASRHVKSDQSWIGSVTTIERGFPLERTRAPQPSATPQPTAYPDRLRMAALEFRLAGPLRATAEARMESEEGTAFEFLPRRKLCRNTTNSVFS